MTEIKHRGAHSEMLACAWLIEQGYEVFRNVSPFGDIDIVGWKDGVFEGFDVKTLPHNSKKTRFARPSQTRRDVKFIIVTQSGKCSIAGPETAAASLTCPACGKGFQARRRRHDQVYCSGWCSNRAHSRDNRLRALAPG